MVHEISIGPRHPGAALTERPLSAECGTLGHMSIEIPKRGTRGAKLPNPPEVLKRPMMWMFEQVMKPRKTPLGYLTTIGAKSGAERTVPLRLFTDGPDSWLVVASLAGSPQNPAWLHNLRAHPDQVRLRVGAATFAVTPTTLPRAERDEVWERIVTEAPDFANYQRSTDRIIPVVRLTRAA